MRRAVSSIALAVLLSVVPNLGAQHKPKQPTSDKGVRDVLRAVEVPFKEEPSLSGLAASPVLSYPIQCNSEGVPFVGMLNPPDFDEEEVYSITSKGVRKFSLDTVNDLFDKEILDYYPAQSGVIFLVFGSEEGQLGARASSPPSANGEDTAHHVQRGYYIAKFDADGSYKGRVRIEPSFTPSKIAEFDSGLFLAYGVDADARRPELALINPDGSVLRYLDPDPSLSNWYKSYLNSTLGRPGDSKPTVLPGGQMVPYLGRLLLVQQGSKLPIFGIRENGEVQQFKTPAPEGYVLESLIPAQNRWYVRYRTEAKPGTQVSREQPVLFVVDPDAGRLLERLKPQGVSTDEIACSRNGDLIAFRRDDKGRFVAILGQVQ